MNIDKCPICGGGLELTLKRYTSGVVVRLGGDEPFPYLAIVDEGQDALDGPEYGKAEVVALYCENDHTEAQILKALKEA